VSVWVLPTVHGISSVVSGHRGTVPGMQGWRGALAVTSIMLVALYSPWMGCFASCLSCMLEATTNMNPTPAMQAQTGRVQAACIAPGCQS
jgi:hypothetical protein